MSKINILELRNYLLKPGRRDRFNTYFSEYFVDSQNVMGGHVLEKFSVAGEEDNFFWVRGFENMPTRSAFLPAFYEGPVWKEFGPEANEMMIDSDNVHLLKPLDATQVFTPGKIMHVDYYFAKDETPDRLTDVLTSEDLKNTSLWVSELGENDFPPLPVFQYKNLLVAISNGDGDLEFQNKLGPLITRKESLLLYEI